MLLNFSSCGSERKNWWDGAILVLAIGVCGVAFGEEHSAVGTIGLKGSAIKLDAPVDTACVGGRGRFLIARLLARREIIVVDLVQRFVSFTIPLGEDDVAFAAGSTQLHVVGRDSNMLQSWNLHTGARLRETASPLSGHVRAIASGSEMDRRLAVCFADSPHQSEPIRLATIEFPSLQVRRLLIPEAPPAPEYHLRAAAGGELFVAWAPQTEPRKRGVVLWNKDNANWLQWLEVPTWILPNGHGSHLFTDVGVFNTTLTVEPGTGVEHPARCISAVTGPMYLTQSDGPEVGVWKLRVLGNALPLATLRFPENATGDIVTTASQLDERVIFSVEANCIVTLSDSSEVVLYELDAKKVLAAATN